MRRIGEKQPFLTTRYVAHPHADELRAVSDLLDEHPEVLDVVHADLVQGRSSRLGRRGLSAEQVIRVAIVQRLRGFASLANLDAVKKLGVNEVMFHKKKGPSDTSAMTSTPKVHRTLWRFRAGIEGCISWLKRSFGLRRSTWSGMAGFCRYVWSSVVTANLLNIARRRLAAA